VRWLAIAAPTLLLPRGAGASTSKRGGLASVVMSVIAGSLLAR
jgi:hypothetical protein